MPRLRLGDADRERLNCPEFMDMDAGSITNREAIELRRLGFATPRMFRAALFARERLPLVDGAGEKVLGPDGEPILEALLNYEAWTALVWLALRRVGVDTDATSLEYDLDRMAYLPDAAPPEPVVEGKAPVPAASTSSTRTSSTRTGTSKRKSRSTSSPS